MFEDVLQCACQGIWLVKQWKLITLYSKVFTMCSIGSGLLLSFSGPLREYIKIKQIQGKGNTEGIGLNGPEEGPVSIGGGRDQDIFPTRASLQAFLTGDSEHGKKAHRGLIFSALLFWGAMAAYPKLFDKKITCDGSPPALGMQLFFGLFVFDIVVQVWVAIHTRKGYQMLLDSIFSFLSGTIFSLLGRFDTYGDVAFTYKLLKCEDITWFSIHDVKYHLPCPLQYVALFALIIGVLCLQAIPGLILLCCLKPLPLALKINEYNLLLQAMGEESKAEQPWE